MTDNRMHTQSFHATRKIAQGFTLAELLVTILILAILVSLAAPSFRSLITSNRLTGQINELVGDLSLARNEASARGRTTRICIADTSTSCATSGTDWAIGRLIWADTNGNGTLDAATEIIKYAPPLDGGVSLVASGPTSVDSISFFAFGGLAGGTAWTFTLCAPGDNKGRQVNVPVTGRATAKRIENC